MGRCVVGCEHCSHPTTLNHSNKCTMVIWLKITATVTIENAVDLINKVNVVTRN